MTQKKKKRPADINKLAASIMKDATEPKEAAPEEPSKEEISRIMSAMGRRGGQKGGPARAKKLTPERRKEIARNAIKARWAKKEN